MLRSLGVFGRIDFGDFPVPLQLRGAKGFELSRLVPGPVEESSPPGRDLPEADWLLVATKHRGKMLPDRRIKRGRFQFGAGGTVEARFFRNYLVNFHWVCLRDGREEAFRVDF